MSENILSLEDLKFLEVLHTKFGLQFLRVDDSGIKINNEQQIIKGIENEPFDNMCYLAEISKKLKFRLNSNFQLNFSHGFNFQVDRL
jgi:hypothetical protein